MITELITTRIPYMSGVLSRAPSNQFYPSLSHQRCSQNSHLGALKICFINFKKLKIMLPASSVLPGLTTYLRSFVLYIGLLSNPAFSTKLLFLPLNQWTTKPFPVSLISSSCMFRLANSVRLPTLDSFIFHPLTSSLLVRRAFFCQAPLLWNNLSRFLRKTMEGEFLP